MITPAGRALLDSSLPGGVRRAPLVGADRRGDGLLRDRRQQAGPGADDATGRPGGRRRTVPNDHADADYDAADHRQARPRPTRRPPRCCARCRRRSARRPVPGPRRHRADPGRGRARPTTSAACAWNSVHTVWFQMHEDLLRLTGPGAPGMTAWGPSYRWLVVPDDPQPSRAGTWWAARRGACGGCARSACACRPRSCVTTEACAALLRGRRLPDGLVDELEAGIRLLEAAAGPHVRRGERPLLVSVRSGAASACPG